ncbi:MAG: acetylhydrolase [Betaproteobacteria bacterium]|nr:acetylhydrolase [Betaproteobacteria bacterium]NBU49038.1 acetylhydrolase [Betaproteobacteria bacterium]
MSRSPLNRRQLLQGLGCSSALGAAASCGAWALWPQGAPAAVPSDASASNQQDGIPSNALSRSNEAYVTLEFDWQDALRSRPVPVRLYLPRSASEARQAPVIVFSHGIGGSRRGYSYLGTHWATRGWASLHVQHVGSDRTLWSGGLWSMVGRLQAAAQDAEAIARAGDLRFALDQLLSGEVGRRLDAHRIIAAGHSYGANTTLLAAGALVQREAGTLDLSDARIKAAIVISAPPFYGEGDPSSILNSVQVPSLHITATEDVIRIPGYYSGLRDRLSVFDATGSARKWLAVFEGGSHSMFTDRTATGGVNLNPKVKAATQDLSVAFLRGVFDGDTSALQEWPRQHAAILARFSART